jgi:hypothetical protein
MPISLPRNSAYSAQPSLCADSASIRRNIGCSRFSAASAICRWWPGTASCSVSAGNAYQARDSSLQVLTQYSAAWSPSTGAGT